MKNQASQEMIKALLDEIKAADKPANRVNYQRFFKEKLEHPIGLRTSVLRTISTRGFRRVKAFDKDTVLYLCDHLLASRERYMRFFAFEWAGKLESRCERSDLARFERWLDHYVGDWADCDGLCCGVIGPLVARFPALSSRTGKWTRSRNLWRRRAAAVSLIVPVRRGLLIDEALRTADALIADSEDLVQKGYGWMLKEAGACFFPKVEAFVMARRGEMPRTALRYAIEKWPAAKRTQAMK
jgi:3-methyladenine DNA glycosylase AlkD